MINIIGEKFVVTGSNGFIGGHIVEALKKQGKEVIEIDLPNDISKIEWMDFSGCDAVFHEACSKCTVCRDDPKKDLMVNAWGSFRIFDTARKAGAKVIHASTGSVYGESGLIQTHEGLQYAPKSFYGVSKLAGEQYLRAFHEYDNNFKFVSLRYFHVYGPRQCAGPGGGVVAIFIKKILRGEPIQIYGDGNQVRSFTYVKDVVDANFLAYNSECMEGEYFNVASGAHIRLNTLIAEIEVITGVEAKREYLPSRKGDIRSFNVSNVKIGENGMSKWTPFDDGLEQTVRWYRDNPQA